MDKSLKAEHLNKCASCHMKKRYDLYYSCKYGNDLFGDDAAENECPDRFVHPQEHVISKRESFND